MWRTKNLMNKNKGVTRVGSGDLLGGMAQFSCVNISKDYRHHRLGGGSLTYHEFWESRRRPIHQSETTQSSEPSTNHSPATEKKSSGGQTASHPHNHMLPIPASAPSRQPVATSAAKSHQLKICVWRLIVSLRWNGEAPQTDLRRLLQWSYQSIRDIALRACFPHRQNNSSTLNNSCDVMPPNYV